MKNNVLRNKIMPLLVIPIAGLIVLALCYILYYAIYMIIEVAIFKGNYENIRVDLIRLSYTIFVVLSFIAILRSKWHDLVKAILMFAPIAMVVITGILRFFETPIFAAAIAVVVAVLVAVWIYASKKPWFFYYSALLAVAAGVFYAWPK